MDVFFFLSDNRIVTSPDRANDTVISVLYALSSLICLFVEKFIPQARLFENSQKLYF